MKFLLIAPRFHTNLYYRMDALKQAGHQVKILVLYKGKSEYYKNIDPEILPPAYLSKLILHVIALFKRNYLKTSLELRLQWPGKELKKQLRVYQPNVILLKSYQEILAVKTLFLAKKYKIKVLMFTQTMYTNIKGSKLLFKLNILWFRYLKVHSYITPIEGNYMAFKDFGIQNVFYLPFVYPVNNDLKRNDGSDIINILSIGKFVRRKDHLLLIKAIQVLIANHKVRLAIIGEKADLTYYKEIASYILSHNLQDYVTIKEHLAYPEIQEEYRKHHLFVMAAFAEPAAYSPVEALANGLPVILSSDSGTKCYIHNDIDGFIFEKRNLNDLILKIEDVIKNKLQLTKMSVAALETARKYHNLPGFSDQIMKIIDG